MIRQPLAYLGQEGDSISGLDRRLSLESEGREGLDRERRVALRARGDEARGQGEDLVEAQGGVEGLGEGGLLQLGTQISGVAGLDGQDGPSSCEVCLAHDVGGSTEVGRDTDALEDGGGGKECRDVLVSEGVFALLDGGDAGG